MAKRVTRIEGMSPLQALVTSRMRELSLDPQAVEKRGVKHATLHRYMNPVRLFQMPRVAILEAFAKALEVDVDEVRQAAKDSLGETPKNDWRITYELGDVNGKLAVTVLIDRIDRLPCTVDDMQRGLDALLDSLRDTDAQEQADAFPVAARRGTPLRRQAPGADEGA